MAGVEFKGVWKRFGDVVAVEDLTLEIIDREFLVFLGPSGCGKSTALRMIAGLEEPSEGTVSIGDEVVNGVDPRDRDVAMVFQSYALYPHMTVYKNIEAPLLTRPMEPPDGGAPRKLTKEERAVKVKEAAAILGLEAYLDRKPGALSGGQRQRVALARAIVRRPRVFLMDEPLSNLDAKLRTQTRLELVELWRRLGITFVYVTHDQVEAMTMASRVAIIAEGRLQQLGPPQDVYERPANLFVARFIGSPPMNTFDAVARPAAGGMVAQAGAAVVPLPAGLGVSPDQAVTVAVRPEHLHITADGPLDGIVRSVELLGHEQHVIIEVSGELMVIRQPSEEPDPVLGTTVRLSPELGRLHVFDQASGLRVE
ncbi:MAG: ABC transporter ATP-binding protein [Microthrixaceae bacterium]|nr:ABC transporter ATP-binding protein [Microthrixaceae bacterium]